MAVRHLTGDISVFSAGGSDLLGLFEDVTLEIRERQRDVSPVGRHYQSAQGLKLEGSISTTIMDTVSAPDRVSHLNLTALTLGDNLLAVVRRLRLNVSHTNVEKAGAGSWWVARQVVDGDIAAEVEIESEADTFAPYVADAVSATGADRNATLSFTLNSVVFTIAMRMENLSLAASRDGLQAVTIALKGRSPDSGTYPAAPTGSTSLVEKAINAPRTELAFSFTSKSADGFTLTGNMVWESMEFEVADGEIVNLRYVWQITEAPTAGAT